MTATVDELRRMFDSLAGDTAIDQIGASPVHLQMLNVGHGGEKISMNDPRVGAVERAMQLAPSCRSLDEIRSALTSEGYSNVNAHLSGLSFRKTLSKLMAGR
ncbi:MAG: hypothetical protein ABIO85_10095 [Sphingomicrobium sp.]